MLTRKQKNSYNFFFTIIALAIPFLSTAQCAMCRASLESEGNVAKSESLNDGIVYLMVIPYFLVGVVGIIIYVMFYKKKNNSVTD